MYRIKNSSKYDNLSSGEYKYSNPESLIVYLDGENNTGEGHDGTKSQWYNLAWSENLMNSFNDIQKNFQLYGGGNSYNDISFTWKSNGLVFDGSGDYVLLKNALPDGSQEIVLEVVFEIFNFKEQVIISNSSAEIGINSMGNLYGYIDGKDFSYGYINTSEHIEKDKIYHAAITYDGKESCLYLNGKLVGSNTSCITNVASFNTLPETSLKIDNKKIGFRINAYIGEPEVEDSDRGITLKFYSPSGYEYRELINDDKKLNDNNFKIQSSYYYENDVKKMSENPLYYYKNFSNLKEEQNLRFNFNISYLYNSQIKQKNIDIENVQIGSNVTNKDIEIVAKGCDSVIIKSNVGQIENWYISDDSNVGGKEIKYEKTTKILGANYYCFKSNLIPSKHYSIWGTYDSAKSTTLKENFNNVYLGKKLNGDAVTSFSGVIYAVRCYNKILNADNIMTNYKIDKSRFSIKD